MNLPDTSLLEWLKVGGGWALAVIGLYLFVTGRIAPTKPFERLLERSDERERLSRDLFDRAIRVIEDQNRIIHEQQRKPPKGGGT